MDHAGKLERFEILLVKKWDTDEIRSLYREAGWWDETWDPVHITPLITGSLAFAVAVDRNSGIAIGMGRVLSDGISDAYIQDLVVKSEFRNSGIGRKLIAILISFCQAKGITWIALIAGPGTEQFYIPEGFTRMEGYVPMLFRGSLTGDKSDVDQT